MKSLKVSDKNPNRLLVEGKDDLHTVIHLLRRHGVDYDTPKPDYPYIHATEGYSELLEAIPVSAKSHRKLGILIDADADVAARWSSVRDRLRAAGVSVPNDLPTEGLVTAGMMPQTTLGVWLMPNNADPGMLEDFLAQLVPDGDQCWPHAETATRTAKTLGASFGETHFTKARIHTWLAWQTEPGQPFGIAITAAYFRHDGATARSFVAWFRRLFF